MRSSQIIYQIDVNDVQSLATKFLDHKLSKEEINQIERLPGDYINWHDTIEHTFSKLKILPENGE